MRTDGTSLNEGGMFTYSGKRKNSKKRYSKEQLIRHILQYKDGVMDSYYTDSISWIKMARDIKLCDDMIDFIKRTL